MQAAAAPYGAAADQGVLWVRLVSLPYCMPVGFEVEPIGLLSRGAFVYCQRFPRRPLTVHVVNR
jgi:hypothetical protein